MQWVFGCFSSRALSQPEKRLRMHVFHAAPECDEPSPAYSACLSWPRLTRAWRYKLILQPDAIKAPMAAKMAIQKIHKDFGPMFHSKRPGFTMPCAIAHPDHYPQAKICKGAARGPGPTLLRQPAQRRGLAQDCSRKEQPTQVETQSPMPQMAHC